MAHAPREMLHRLCRTGMRKSVKKCAWERGVARQQAMQRLKKRFAQKKSIAFGKYAESKNTGGPAITEGHAEYDLSMPAM